jgi:hypothetical protein
MNSETRQHSMSKSWLVVMCAAAATAVFFVSGCSPGTKESPPAAAPATAPATEQAPAAPAAAEQPKPDHPKSEHPN